MAAAEFREADLACRDVVVRFYRALDAGEYGRVAGLMAPQGEWLRQGKLLRGAEAVEQALSERHPDVVSVHGISNFLLDALDGQTAHVSYYVTVLRSSEAAQAGGVPRVPATRAIQLCSDVLVATGGQWRFERKASRAIFRSE